MGFTQGNAVPCQEHTASTTREALIDQNAPSKNRKGNIEENTVANDIVLKHEIGTKN